MERCYFCDNDELMDSCVNCYKDICDECLDKWYIMVVIGKCKEFDVSGDHNICILCAHNPQEVLPEYNAMDKVKYNILLKHREIQWYETKSLSEMRNLTCENFRAFFCLCGRLQKFHDDFFIRFHQEHFNTINQFINYICYSIPVFRLYKLNENEKAAQISENRTLLSQVFKIDLDINETAKCRSDLINGLKALQNSIVKWLEQDLKVLQ